MSNKKLMFVFDLANNHMGSVDHGLRVIREIRKATEGFDFDFAFKFQYRQLDTFIHPDFQGREDIKYVKRFSETRLSADELAAMKAEVDKLGFIGVCTPFDEASVDLIEEHNFDIIKIASCSFTDWPLLERIAQTDKPIIASAAGASLDEIDKVVSFFEHRQKDLTLMHCVAEYPTPDDKLQLNQIDLYKARYPYLRIGYSTHESPDNVEAVKMAVAKGATVLEKHVAVPTEAYGINAYSATPAQVNAWVSAAQKAVEMNGVAGERYPITEKEISTLRSLRRGVFVKETVNPGDQITPDDVFLAIPTAEGQLTANDLSKYTHVSARTKIGPSRPVMSSGITQANGREQVYDIVQRVKALLQTSRAVVPGKSEFEISHHYGLEKFEEIGTTIISLINREYCKKLIVMLPGQSHPEQYHEQKEESFHVLHGEIELTLNGETRTCRPGDIVTVERGVKHAFKSEPGAVIEELSSTHYKADSFYTDPAIGRNPNRKTRLTYWLE